MSEQTTKKVFTFICERAPEIDSCLKNGSDEFKDIPGLHAVKFPCSGMIQPLMVEAALKAGAEGVIVTGCQIGDCYYREGNKMIRERLLGIRGPMLKKATDRRRILALWLSRLQTDRFLSECKEFMAYVKDLPAPDPAAKPAAAAAPKAEPKKEAAPKTEEKKEETKTAEPSAEANKPEESEKKKDAESKEKSKAGETKKKDTEAKADKSGDGKATEDDGKSDKSNGTKEDK